MSGEGADANAAGPLDELVDLAIFAPLGLALEYRKLIPELADTGRKQLAFAQTLGRAALKTMASSAARKTEPSAPASAPAAPSGAISGYDSMTAKEIISMATTATADQLAWMLSREQAGKTRKTVLAKLEQRSG